MQARVEDALVVLDAGRTPPCPEPCEAPACPNGPERYRPAWRDATWTAAEAARARARRECARPRDRLSDEREAVLQVLEERGVLFRVRGGVHVLRVKAEVFS